MPVKIDFKRELRDLYLPSRRPVLVEVPEMAFLMVDGHGDPNTATFRDATEALYTVAYGAKFAVKRGGSGIDFSVMPLEGLWSSADMTSFSSGAKSEWDWTAMIMQPEPVCAQTIDQVREQAAAKRSLPALELVRYKRFAEGMAAQLLYTGPYRDEGPTVAALHAFIAAEGLVPAGAHHEIYLSDPRRTAPERLRTVIRQPVAPKDQDS